MNPNVRKRLSRFYAATKVNAEPCKRCKDKQRSEGSLWCAGCIAEVGMCQSEGCAFLGFWAEGWCFKHHPPNGPIKYHTGGPVSDSGPILEPGPASFVVYSEPEDTES